MFRGCKSGATLARLPRLRNAHQDRGQENEALGYSPGGFSTKLHTVTDGLGNPLRFLLTPGQAHDLTQGEALLLGFQGDYVLADKADDSNQLLEFIAQMDAEAVIPPRQNRKQARHYDREVYKERHLIECFFNKVKYYRRVFSRFEKRAKNYLGFVYFVSSLIWFR